MCVFVCVYVCVHGFISLYISPLSGYHRYLTFNTNRLTTEQWEQETIDVTTKKPCSKNSQTMNEANNHYRNNGKSIIYKIDCIIPRIFIYKTHSLLKRLKFHPTGGISISRMNFRTKVKIRENRQSSWQSTVLY